MSIKTSVHAYNKAFNLYSEVATLFDSMVNTEEEPSDYQYMEALDKAEDLQKQLNKIEISDIEEYLKQKGKETALADVKDNMSKMREEVYYISRRLLGNSYYSDLQKAVPRFVSSLQRKHSFKYHGEAQDLAKEFIGLITNPDRVERYKSNIEAIIRGNMTLPYFQRIFDAIMTAKKNKGTGAKEEMPWAGEEKYFASPEQTAKDKEIQAKVKAEMEATEKARKEKELQQERDKKDVADDISKKAPKEFTKKVGTRVKHFIKLPDGTEVEYFNDAVIPSGGHTIHKYFDKKGNKVYSYLKESFIPLAKYKKLLSL